VTEGSAPMRFVLVARNTDTIGFEPIPPQMDGSGPNDLAGPKYGHRIMPFP
jgi:hypothetical protein